MEWATTDPNVCVQVHARVAVDANPQDYGALAKWGELLLELAMTKEGVDHVRRLLAFRVDVVRKDGLLVVVRR